MLLKVTLLFMLGVAQTSLLEDLEAISADGEKSKEDKIIAIKNFINDQSENDSLGILYHEAAKDVRKFDLKQAVNWQKEAIRIFKEKSDTIYLVKGLYNQGFYFSELENQTLEENSYLDLIAYNLNDKITGKAYSALGTFSMGKGDYFRADKYYRKAEEILSKTPDSEKSLLKNKLGYIALLFRISSIEKVMEIEVLLNEVDSLVASLTLNYPEKYDILSRKSFFYDDLGRYDEAIRDRKEALSIALNIKDSMRIADSYNNLAVSYTKTKEFASATTYLKQVLEYAAEEDQFVAAAYNNMGDTYMAMRNLDEALFFYQKSIDTYLDKKNSIRSSLTEMMETCLFKDNLMQAIISKIDFYKSKYNITSKKNNLDSLLSSVKLADDLLGILRSQSFENNSKLYWREKAHAVYGKGIWAASQNDDNESYFYFMEKNKAVLLLENLTETQAQLIGGIPEETRKRGTSLRSKSLNQLEDGIDNYFTYKNFLDSVKATFPKYSDIKQQLKVLSLKEVFKSFDFLNDGGVLQFFVDTQNAYALYLNRDSVFRFDVGNVDILKKDVTDFKILCSKPLRSKESIKLFTAIAKRLYDKLIPSQIHNTDKLLIIADGFLQDIPFEALSIENDMENLAANFLINNYEVSYAYSLSHLIKNNSVARKNKFGFLGVAPEQFSDPILADLINSTMEVKAANKVLDGNSFIGEDASKEHFLKVMDQYQIIHLSTHASSGSADSSWISFRDNKLAGYEIYGEKNDADLIVLSACNTSVGEMIAGEGIMSLSRAFFHAGAASVLSTLWNVNDQVSAEIITDFYEALVAGYTRSASLRSAKLKYLQSRNGSEISPYYWSSYILIGDSSTLDIQQNSQVKKTFFWLLPFVLLMIVFAYFKKSRKSV